MHQSIYADRLEPDECHQFDSSRIMRQKSRDSTSRSEKRKKDDLCPVLTLGRRCESITPKQQAFLLKMRLIL